MTAFPKQILHTISVYNMHTPTENTGVSGGSAVDLPSVLRETVWPHFTSLPYHVRLILKEWVVSFKMTLVFF